MKKFLYRHLHSPKNSVTIQAIYPLCRKNSRSERNSMKLHFAKDQWNTEDVTYAYSRRFQETPVFVQKEEWVESTENPAATYGFDNISLLTKEKVGTGVKITTECAFFDDGAPLIVLAESMEPDAGGVLRYGNYFEVVLYKNGINVWRLWEEGGKVVWHKRLGVEFPLEPGVWHTLTVETREKILHITVNGTYRMHLRAEDLFESCHVGIDACEGINRFRMLEVE